MNWLLILLFVGDILSIEANHLLDPGSAGLIMSDWTRHSKLSHSLLMESFIYDIDLLSWLLGSLPSQVMSFSGRNMFIPNRVPQMVIKKNSFLTLESKIIFIYLFCFVFLA